MAAFDNVSLPSPPNIATAGQFGQQLFNMLQSMGQDYQQGQNFRYQQRQQNFFQDPNNQALLQDAIKNGNIGPLYQKLVEVGGAQSAGPILQQILGLKSDEDLAAAIRGASPGGATPVNTTPTAQGPTALTNAAQGQGQGQGATSPRIPYTQPSLSATGTDNEGADTVRSLTAGLANGRPVSPATIANYARALGVDPDAGLSEDQAQRAQTMIANSLARQGSSQAAPPATNDAASGGRPPINAASANQGNESPAVGAGGGAAISPAPTAAAGAIQPSGPRVAQASPAPAGDTFGDRFGASYGNQPGARPTPVGTEDEARRLMAQGNEILARGARAARFSPAAKDLAEKTAQPLFDRAKQIFESIGKYNEPGTNPDVQSELKTSEGVGTAIGKYIGEVIERGGSAYKRLQLLDTVGEALKQGHGNITTGPFAKSALSLKQAISSAFGVEIPGTAEAEVAQKTGFALASQAVKEITSRPTQREVTLALENNPGLLLSEKGSGFMIDVMKQAARQDAQLRKMAFRKENRANWAEVEDNFYKEHPLMSPFDHKRPLGMQDIEALGGGAEGGASGQTQAAPRRFRWTPQGLQPVQ